jgi:hypothetical protein
VKTTLGETSYYLQSMIGIFGWLDTTLPGWLYHVFAGIVVLLVALALAIGRRRIILAMLGTALVVLVLPVLVQYSQAKYLGFIWQGRYMLPLAVGVPILAGLAVQDRPHAVPLWVSRRVLRVAVVAAAAGHVVAFGVNLHRYVNGTDGEWIGWGSESWLPPVPLWLLVAGYAVAWAALAVLFLAAAETTSGGPESDGDHGGRDAGAHVTEGAVPDEAVPDEAVPDDAGTQHRRTAPVAAMPTPHGST